MKLPGRSGALSASGLWQDGGSSTALPANPVYNSRTGNEPLEYKATETISFVEGFESGVNDAFEAYITTDNGSGSGNDGSGAGVYADGGYRYGFNGKENDLEISGDGNQYDYGFRIYNPRLGRFLSVDPLFKSYPWYTPYQFAGNKPIIAVDLDGLEEQETNVIDVFVITADPIASKTAKTMASTNPRGLVLLQQQSWNQIVVEINDIVQKQFNPNYNIDPEFTTRVKDAMYGYFGTNALSKYTSYSLYAGGDVTGIQQSAMDKAFEIANDYARSRFFGDAAYNNYLNKINQAKDPNTKAALIQERHDRTTQNYHFVWFTNLQMMELFTGFMTLGENNIGPLNRTSGFSLENANAAKYKKVDDLISDAGTLTRLKGGVKQGTIKGDAYDVLQGLAKQYGAELQADSKGGIFFQSGELRMGMHNSTRTGVPTIDVNNSGKTYKIRVENE
ncbi:RHS repeat-associated core domain-containing protein [Flavisolibacter nicotianae]|uniref:RHS repeat-associated core domain-containing protein n=1 Tax=Flavisolibacter nicotianae TaxID=2364882 RepID=UPI000EB100EF|nr:RHS repeat-associated core domain-containing protein [Flavisolibacter nicotianae]